jgi:hypothetical protein
LGREYGRIWANVGLCDNVMMRGLGVVAGGGCEWCLVVICGGGGGVVNSGDGRHEEELCWLSESDGGKSIEKVKTMT